METIKLKEKKINWKKIISIIAIVSLIALLLYLKVIFCVAYKYYLIDLDKNVSIIGYSQNKYLVNDTMYEQLNILEQKGHRIYDYNLKKGIINRPVIVLKSKLNDKKIIKIIQDNIYTIELER